MICNNRRAALTIILEASSVCKTELEDNDENVENKSEAPPMLIVEIMDFSSSVIAFVIFDTNDCATSNDRRELTAAGAMD